MKLLSRPLKRKDKQVKNKLNLYDSRIKKSQFTNRLEFK